MTIEQFRNAIEDIVPIHWESDFYIELESIYNLYCYWVGLLNISPDTTFRVEYICKQILEIIDLYKNDRDKAFKRFYFLAYGIDDGVGLFSNIGYKHIKKGQLFYRVRPLESDTIFSRQDMFHISQSRRDIVKSQRYSHSGFPCLYMGYSVLSCWREMRQPSWDNLAYTALKTRYPFPVFDMSTPSTNDFDDCNILRTIQRLPLIMACGVRVKDDDAINKPEYIIPQLMLDAIIYKNQGITQTDRNLYDLDIVWGICYSSTRISDDSRQNPKLLQNVVFPIIEDNWTAKYCNHLASLFELTKPFQYTSEKILSSSLSGSSSLDKNILISQFIEQDLVSHDFKPLDHLVINTPQNCVIELDYLGNEVSIEIRSNIHWEIL